MTMINQSNLSHMHSEPEERERQHLNNLVSAISRHLQHPDGTDLVCVLGSGYEENNRQALETWVTSQSQELKEKRLEGYRPLELLMDRLETLLCE